MPAVVIERPKLSRPMWEALKFHVTRERQRKKQGNEFCVVMMLLQILMCSI